MEKLLSRAGRCSRKSTRLQDWKGCGSHPTHVYPGCWKPVPSTEHFIAKRVWINKLIINIGAVCLSHAWINPSLTSYWLHFLTLLQVHTEKGTEAAHAHEAVSCNKPWKNIYQSPSFISSWLTKLLHALTLPVLQVCSQQRWRTEAPETGCCAIILKEKLEITWWICRKSCVA